MRIPFLTLIGLRCGACRGVALIATLALLAILSVLLLVFVSITSADRTASQNYSQNIHVDQIARSGLDMIVSQLLAEAAESNLQQTNFNGLSIPQTNAAACGVVPQRMTSGSSQTNQATLIAYSGTNLYTLGKGSKDWSSPSSTLSKSLNGRSISTAVWDAPQLTTSLAGFPLPQWVLMTRSGPKPFSSFTPLMADRTPANVQYVLGRYAYAVYDTSGLLDANVAGYPFNASSNAAGKGFLSWADLTQLSSAMTSKDVTKFVRWRNASSSTSLTAYATNVLLAATNSGFMAVLPRDTAFLNRQELIQYAKTQNTALLAALPYLTVFSRQVNGPTWGPLTTSPSNAYSSPSLKYSGSTSVTNPCLAYPAVKKSFPRLTAGQAVAGEPLLKYRFPLDKLSLLGQTSYSSADLVAIANYFGLTPANDSDPAHYFRHWNYRLGSTGILTLNQVAAQNREPDFFELLQACILNGSLGGQGRGDAISPATRLIAGFVDPDANTALQVLRIGANIIDQYKSDAYPTTITFNQFNVYGISDLPYINKTVMKIWSPNGVSSPPPPYSFYLFFEMWNPHQAPAAGQAILYPSQLRIVPMNATATPASTDRVSDWYQLGYTLVNVPNGGGATKNYHWYYDPSSGSWASYIAGGDTCSHFSNLAVAAVQFPLLHPQSDYRDPSVITNATLGTLSGPGWAPSPAVAGWSLGSLPAAMPVNIPSDDSPSYTTNWVNCKEGSSYVLKCNLSLVLCLQFQDTGGNWHTYSNFVGTDNTNCGTAGTGFWFTPQMTVGSNISSQSLSINVYSIFKTDPRTSRYGATYFNSSTPNPLGNPLVSSYASIAAPNLVGVNDVPLTGTKLSASSTMGYRWDAWVNNNPAVSLSALGANSVTNPQYADPDGVIRWGDGGGTNYTASPIYANDAVARPVILHRPFQSVGELGYVFRDVPWKTLDLYSPNSPDAGLLDAFALSTAPLVAGRVNPNTPYSKVLQALIAGTTQSSASGGTATLSSAAASAVASGIVNATRQQPVIDMGDFVTRMMTNSGVGPALSGFKTEREAVVRALAETANTRTWNFLVDVVAQTGRYPATAGTLDDFFVTGQRRYWLHIAIDRYTGQVVDERLEPVDP